MERQKERADFHAHYDESNIDDVIERANREQVTALGLISKLTLPCPERLDEFVAKGQESGVNILIGIEVEKPINGKSVDIIALGFDTRNEEIQELFDREKRRQRSIDVANHQECVLNEEGFVIQPMNDEDSLILSGMRNGDISDKAIRYCKLILSNPINEMRVNQDIKAESEKWLEIMNYDRPPYKDNLFEKKAKLLWCKYFQSGKRGYVASPDNAEKIIKAVHKAGGVTLISPEGKNGCTFDKDQYSKFLEMGGDGIMAWHGSKLGLEPNHTASENYIPIDIIKETVKSGKLVLGGSDYDPTKNDWQVGVGSGGMYISPRRLVNIREYLEKQKNG